MRRLNPTQTATIAAAALILLLIAYLFVPRGDSDQDRLSDDQVAATESQDALEKRCGSQSTYELIKRELFRQAADTRGSDQSAFDRIATAATARMDRPLFKSKDEGVGLVRCSGRLSLDLPPGLAVVGGRRTLAADIDYVVQPAADGSGDVVMVEGADPIIVPLATLASVGRAPSTPLPAGPLQPSPPAPADPLAPGPPLAEPAAPTPPRLAGPSFDCRSARTRGEIAVCADPALAALDRQMAAQYRQALADPRNAELLRRTRDAFLRYRDRCPTAACVADAYRDRMREIGDIASGNWRPGR